MASHKNGEMDIARALLLSGISQTYAQSHASIKIPHPAPGKQDAVSHHMIAPLIQAEKLV